VTPWRGCGGVGRERNDGVLRGSRTTPVSAMAARPPPLLNPTAAFRPHPASGRTPYRKLTEAVGIVNGLSQPAAPAMRV